MTKQCYFSSNNIKHVDYKDTELLKKFINPHARILKSNHIGVCSKHQRDIATAIKRARFMGLLAYVSR